MIIYEINLNTLMQVHGIKPGQILNYLEKYHKPITYETLSNWRKRKTVPDAIQIKWIANLFGITIDGLYEIRNENKHVTEGK